MELQTAIDAGLEAIDTGDEAAAVSQLEPLVRARPDSALGWQVLGLLYRAMEESQLALSALERASALAPGDGLIANALAQVRLEAGLDAVPAFETALRINPQAQVIQGLAAAHLARGENRQGIELLDSTLRQHPGWSEGQWLLARLRWMAGDRTSYLASLDQALARSPRNAALWQLRIGIQLRSLDFAGLRTSVPQALAALGDQPFLRAAQAAALSELGDRDSADAIYTRLHADPDLGSAIYRMRHLLRCGRPAEAAAFGEALVPRAGTHAWPYLALAWRCMGDKRADWLERQRGLVGTRDIAADIGDIGALANRLRPLHASSAQPLEQSLRGGSQTDGPLLSRIEPEIRNLRKAVIKAMRAHIAGLPPHDPKHPQLMIRRDRPLRFAGAWSVRLGGGGFHVSHVHPEGWFSAVIYLGVPDEVTSDSADKAGWLQLGEPDAALQLDLPAFATIEPKPGRMAIFPSTLWHGTRKFTEGERLTVALDVARPAAIKG